MKKLLLLAGLLVSVQTFVNAGAEMPSNSQEQASSQQDDGQNQPLYSAEFCQNVKQGLIRLKTSPEGYQRMVDECRRVGVSLPPMRF